VYSSFWSVLSLLFLLAHLVPPVVGLVLVARIRTQRRWRTWALLFFGLSLFAGLSQAALTGSWWFMGTWGMNAYPVIAVVQAGLGLVALAASGFGVLAVVADRAADPVAGPPPPTPYPQQQHPPRA
jgi:hypothetical protein